MVPLPRLNEAELDLLVSYPIGDEESVCGAVVDAFLAANVDVFDRSSSIEQWIDTDALEGFDWRAGDPLYVSTAIWNHGVVVTSDEVRIYSEPPNG